jgi:hypothetical protein
MVEKGAVARSDENSGAVCFLTGCFAVEVVSSLENSAGTTSRTKNGVGGAKTLRRTAGRTSQVCPSNINQIKSIVAFRPSK